MSASYMRACAGKERLETREKGNYRRAGLAVYLGKPISSFSVYPCIQCQGFHVGSALNAFITRRRRTGKRPNRRMRGRV